MKKILAILFIYFGSLALAEAKTIKVAVIDSGLVDPNKVIKLCPGESRDFTGEGLETDSWKHGTNISFIIDSINHDLDYCQIIIKIFTKTSNVDSMKLSIKALEYLNTITDLAFINYSAGGYEAHPVEEHLVKKLLNKGVLFFAAAGNGKKDYETREFIGQNLDKDCSYYPACYDTRIFIVGNIYKSGKRYPSSNYGNERVIIYANGVDIEAGGHTFTGTSQATAIASGQAINTYIRQPQGNEKLALEKSAEAFYIQSGLKDMTNNLYKRKVNDKVQDVVGKLVPFSKMILDGKVQMETSF